MDQYFDIFIAEARELLQELNDLTIALEQEPNSTALLNELFRFAHSFKGAAATMGFTQMTALTHELEHVLDQARTGKTQITQQAASALLAALDCLEQAVDNVEADGSEDVDADAVVAQLRAVDSAGSETIIQHPFPPEYVNELTVVAVRLAEDCDAPSLRAYLVLQALDSMGEIALSHPTPDDLDDFESYELFFAFADDIDSSELENVLSRVSDIASFELLPSATEAQNVEKVAAPAERLTAPGSTEAAAADAKLEKPAKAAKQSKTQSRAGTVRVDSERLDSLMHMMGEVLVHRAHVEEQLRVSDIQGAQEAMHELRRGIQALQNEVMQVRMVPVSTGLMRMPRLVRDLAGKLDKNVQLVMSGTDTQIDRSVVDVLADPIIHLIRNALDHGIESREARQDAGKPEQATIKIHAEHSGDHVIIEISDDGQGVNEELVLKRALEREVVTKEWAAEASSDEVCNLIFHPGFSTAEQATDISGRGVGMDSVRAICKEWGGDVSLSSSAGEGTTARMRIPLSLVLVRALVVEAPTGQSMGIPIERIERTIRLESLVIADSENGQKIAQLDDGVVALDDLGACTGFGECTDPRYGVVVSYGSERRVLAVDALRGELETVSRPLPQAALDGSVFSGAMIQADGSIAVILDCERLPNSGDKVA